MEIAPHSFFKSVVWFLAGSVSTGKPGFTMQGPLARAAATAAAQKADRPAAPVAADKGAQRVLASVAANGDCECLSACRNLKQLVVMIGSCNGTTLAALHVDR